MRFKVSKFENDLLYARVENNLELVLCSVARQYLAASQIIITLHREHWPVLRTTKLVEIELENVCYATVREEFTITEKAPNGSFSWLRAPTSTFTFKTLLRHYAKQELPHSKKT